MKRFPNIFKYIIVILFTINPFYLFTQEIRTLEGINYTIITPTVYAFNADNGTLKLGQKYVIEGNVLNTQGATLYIQGSGLLNQFKMNAPLKLDYGTKVTLYVELTIITPYSTEAKIIKIEGSGISTTTVNTNTGNKTFNGKNYLIIDPTTYAFNAETGKLKTGELYVIDGHVLNISGATLTLQDSGLLNQFKLYEPSDLKFGANVRIYIEIINITNYLTEAKIIKLES